jgi:hypothetical protein
MRTETHGENVTVIKRCCVCGKDACVTVDRTKFDRWYNGEHIQNVWPEMSPDVREMMISGTHPKCWEELFNEEEDSSN